ncbi:MAG: hypothetical protein A2915_00925 [Candidatus Yanofskybacteria bacterium RIFCSPLOWO2_01_FULL_41_34]|uniref:DUF5659 domain-containing protein n=1 Tax=Candidatus Yanofskybacteria bacterium RIFCSPHIGHO2_01_FULL_41_26 TaxID=1802661 RepID=A0A1F8EDT3_9BACT|nr:MAG: hypothetical protein A2649_02965 [Candidatus Yanofskybacteria bacterium RIFCSPHIGHO2_01_FULL_41_26]OGN22455.1 MAG: hypothetical protein A2915_00925 [Candidatus Yanofskybacteria bacterium RIFCSPLOWO2_01_FULL_41_34]
MDKNKYFRTANFYAACYLFSRGLELVGINKDNPQKCEFVFIDIPEREILLAAFNFGKENSPEMMVDFRKAVLAIRTLKDKLYQP